MDEYLMNLYYIFPIWVFDVLSYSLDLPLKWHLNPVMKWKHVIRFVSILIANPHVAT